MSNKRTIILQNPNNDRVNYVKIMASGPGMVLDTQTSAGLYLNTSNSGGYSSALANVVASELLSKIKLLANIAEVSDVITLSVYNLSNQIETFYGSLSWLEQQ